MALLGGGGLKTDYPPPLVEPGLLLKLTTDHIIDRDKERPESVHSCIWNDLREHHPPHHHQSFLLRLLQEEGTHITTVHG